MEFRVMSRHLAEQYVSQKHDEKYAVISISNVRGDRAFLQKIAVPDCGMITCLNLAFDDVYIGESYGVAMTDFQAQAIIAFVESKLDKVESFIVKQGSHALQVQLPHFQNGLMVKIGIIF